MTVSQSLALKCKHWARISFSGRWWESAARTKLGAIQIPICPSHPSEKEHRRYGVILRHAHQHIDRGLLKLHATLLQRHVRATAEVKFYVAAGICQSLFVGAVHV